MRVELHPEERAELHRAALWYDERRVGLGDEFVAEVSSAFTRITEYPAAHQRWPGTRATPPLIRRALIPRFPYAIAFEQHEPYVLVVAVAHTKRRPLYWTARITP